MNKLTDAQGQPYTTMVWDVNVNKWRLLLFYSDGSKLLESWWSPHETYSYLIKFKRPGDIVCDAEYIKLVSRNKKELLLKK